MRLEPADSTHVTTTATTAIVCAAPCILHGVYLSPAAASCDVTVYDNASTTTSAVIKMHLNGAAAGATASYNGSGSGIVMNQGCVVYVTGAGATADIVWARTN